MPWPIPAQTHQIDQARQCQQKVHYLELHYQEVIELDFHLDLVRMEVEVIPLPYECHVLMALFHLSGLPPIDDIH